VGLRSCSGFSPAYGDRRQPLPDNSPGGATGYQVLRSARPRALSVTAITNRGGSLVVRNEYFRRQRVNQIGRPARSGVKSGAGWMVAAARSSRVDANQYSTLPGPRQQRFEVQRRVSFGAQISTTLRSRTCTDALPTLGVSAAPSTESQ
jgi:hypothetical protein